MSTNYNPAGEPSPPYPPPYNYTSFQSHTQPQRILQLHVQHDLLVQQPPIPGEEDRNNNIPGGARPRGPVPQQAPATFFPPPPPPRYPPLAPPPLPPQFPWATPLDNLGPGLPFVPVEVVSLPVVPALTMDSHLEGMDRSWPKELREQFQPLYCKLCRLTLSSTVVASDHYRGKKHRRKCDLWLDGNKRDGVRSGSNATPLGRPVTQISRSNYNGGQSQGHSKSIPLKRPFPTESTKKFPLGKPENQMLAKKAKMDGSGPNFGYCQVCKVTLTSQVNSDQHYSGKPHKTRVLTLRKNGEFDVHSDPRYGIGTAHLIAHQNAKSQNQIPGKVPIPPVSHAKSRTVPEANRKIDKPKLDMNAAVGMRLF